MKRLFVLSLFLFSVSVFGQATVDFDTTGHSFTWTVFANGTGMQILVSLQIQVKLESIHRIVVYDLKLMLMLQILGWCFCTDFPDFTLDAN